MTQPQMEEVGALMRAVAAEVIWPRFRALKDHEVMDKGAGDIVTAADIDSEARLTEALRKMAPDSLVVGEEAHHADPAILARVDGDAPVWVIDPLDGTRNFSRGRETFCMLVAYVVGHEARRGWLYDPATDRLAMAEAGAGATLDGRPLKSAAAPAESAMIGQINLNWFPADRRGRVEREARLRFGAFDRLYCAGHDFLGQALDQRHFSFYRRLWPWDHAAGVLIRREAGGVVDRLDAAPYRAGARVEGLLSAPDPDSWARLAAFLRAG